MFFVKSKSRPSSQPDFDADHTVISIWNMIMGYNGIPVFREDSALLNLESQLLEPVLSNCKVCGILVG